MFLKLLRTQQPSDPFRLWLLGDDCEILQDWARTVALPQDWNQDHPNTIYGVTLQLFADSMLELH